MGDNIKIDLEEIIWGVELSASGQEQVHG